MQQPLGFVLPPNTNEVNGQPGGDDTEPDGALNRSLPERHDDEEEAGQNEAYRQQDVDLRSEGRAEVCQIPPSEVLQLYFTKEQLEVVCEIPSSSVEPGSWQRNRSSWFRSSVSMGFEQIHSCRPNVNNILINQLCVAINK